MSFPVRYRVLALATALAGITYLDRVCISITAPQMQEELGLSKVQMGYVFSAFTLAYALFEIPTGHWGDTYGTRRVLTRIVAWWSSFTILTGTVFNYWSLLSMRFLFGAGEAGAWPNVGRTFSRWFPQKERGTVQGIFFMGAHLGGGITPILVTWLSQYLHWRQLFFLFGAIGFVWCAVWWWWFRDEPAEHPAVTKEELAEIEAGRPNLARHEMTMERWKQLFSHSSIVFLCLMYFTQSYGTMFYITWLPQYLKNERGFDANALAILAGSPLILSVFADLFGGISSDWASRRFGVRLGRALVGGVSLFFAGLCVLAGTWISDPMTSAVLIAIGGGASAFLLGAAWSTVIELGGSHAGVVGAAMNTSGQVGAFVCPIIAGYSIQYFENWAAPLYITGGLYVLGSLCWAKIDPEKPLWNTPQLAPEGSHS